MDLHFLVHMLEHTIKDCLHMLPFLFIAFLVLEALEHHAGDKINKALTVSDKAGPVLGAALGCIPQCGFSVFSANLYSGGVITLGTLLAVFLSTSDEALVILLSQPHHSKEILKLLGLKVLIGIVFGYIVDFVLHKHPLKKKSVSDFCEKEHCHCEEHKGILYPTFLHTAKVFGFIFLFTLILNVAMHTLGEEKLSEILLGNTIFQPFLAGLIGLIPNCAASVLLTQLYLNGAISFASVMAGLCSGAGVGLLVLFRTNHNPKENLAIVGILYAISVFSGMILQLIPALA